jgi:CRISPR-associated protein Csx10
VWQQYQRLGGKGNGKEGRYFTLTLRSDAVLRTIEGLPTMVFDEKMLKQATGIEAELVRSYASYGYSGGWQSAWGLPKPAQVLSRCGSVYVYRAKSGLAPADYQALAELERRGIGELTPEGYGQVRVADAFHLKRR